MHAKRSSPVTIEVCADSLASALAARDGGADRIELCAEMEVGGLTPDHTLVEAVLGAVDIPVHVMVRPRGGDFLYTRSEFALMKKNVETFGRLGCAGIVTGFLDSSEMPDVNRTTEIVRLSGDMAVTFHRAIDLTPDIFDAATSVARTGVRRILTSGGAADATAGAPVIARLVDNIRGMIFIAAGGITSENVAGIVESTGVSEIHSWRGVTMMKRVDPARVRLLKKNTTQRP